MNLYIGNLPHDVSEADIAALFVQFGEVLSVKIMRDRDTWEPRGFGFVELADERAGQAAIAHLNGAQAFDGRTIKVSNAVRRQQPFQQFNQGGNQGYGYQQPYQNQGYPQQGYQQQGYQGGYPQQRRPRIARDQRPNGYQQQGGYQPRGYQDNGGYPDNGYQQQGYAAGNDYQQPYQQGGRDHHNGGNWGGQQQGQGRDWGRRPGSSQGEPDGYME